MENNGIFLKEMGRKIKEARMAKNWSQRQLAERCGLDPTSFWRIEVGQKNSYVLTLKNIAEKLEIDVKDLF